MRQEKEVMKEEKSSKPILLDRVKINGKQTKSLSRPDIEIKPKNIAMKMALNDRKLYKFEELLRNQESFQLESLESSEDSQYQSDFSSEDSSLEAIDWEEFKRDSLNQAENIEELLEPIRLIEKLESYSRDQLSKLSYHDKHKLLQEVNFYLKNGVTPVEKYYEELKSVFKIPSKSLINYDKIHFYKQLKAVRISHSEYVKEIKKQNKIITERLIKKTISNLEEALEKEACRIMYKEQQAKQKIEELTLDNCKCKEMLKDQEEEITRLRQLNKLAVANFNPGVISDQEKEDILFMMKAIEEIDSKSYELNQDLLKGSDDFARSQMVDSIDKAFKYIGLQPQALKIKNDPLLRDEFQFFNSSIALKQKDKVDVVMNEASSYYKACIRYLRKTIQEKNSEIKSSAEMNNMYRQEIIQLETTNKEHSTEIINITSKIEALKIKHSNEVKRDKERSKTDKKALIKSFLEWKEVVEAEIGIKEAIIRRQQKHNSKMSEDVKNLKEVIQIPRYHFKNLEKLSFDEIMQQKKMIEEGTIPSRQESGSSRSHNGQTRPESLIKSSKTVLKAKRAVGTPKRGSVRHQFPVIRKNTYKLSQRRHLMRNGVSPETYHTITRSEIPSILLKSTETPTHHSIFTTLDSRRPSPRPHPLEPSLKSFSKGSLYSLIRTANGCNPKKKSVASRTLL
ncbi:unnamed protein product [Moneuplotes crassus]|uniref:Uncharacterized protein n=1 Tax=Euplotes crassus TaxID=5936 RepID=A0AAD2DAR6_EUPCR|nr:unnamed protein product [Moneuplotes crassus]